ncbi:MAG: sugar transferase [bacterium]|nr:sugar transferase [bacterium]
MSTKLVGTGHGRTRLYAIPLLAFCCDAVGTAMAFLAAYWFRFYSPLTQWFPVIHGIPPFQTILKGYLIGFTFLFLIFVGRGFYHFTAGRGYRDDLPLMMKQIFIAWILLIAFNFFYRDDTWSRLMYTILLFTWLASIVICRWFTFRIKRALHHNGRGMLRCALIGKGETAVLLNERLKVLYHNGLEYLGWISVGTDGDLPEKDKIGILEDLDTLRKEYRIERLVVSLPEEEHEKLYSIVQTLTGKDIEIAYVPVRLQQLTSRLETRDIGGITVLELKGVPLSGWRAVFKRCFDVVVSLIALMVLSPLFLLIAVLVKLGSKGPVFYGQERVTIGGKIYTCWKFRSMVQDAESKTGAVWAVKGDSRVTPIGKILRRTSLDELPQLWNVLKGDMSLVGPRPERPQFVEKFEKEIPRYHERHRVRTGMTGWAQVTGLRGQAPIAIRTIADLTYVENWSFGLDIKIILMTFYAVIWGKDAY